MNGFKPTIGVEFDDDYINAKNKLMDFAKAVNKLTPKQREQLAKELMTATGMATAFQQFINYIRAGGQV